MFFIYDKDKKAINSCEETNFRSHGILERQDIEKWITEYPDILGEDLLIVTNEYNKFDKTNERLDILAIDRNSNLVIVELKRDDSGKTADLQALKYAAYCSNLLFDDVVQEHFEFTKRSNEVIEKAQAQKRLQDFVIDAQGLKEKIDKNKCHRVIVVAREFRPEVTASVLWLRKFGIDIRCVKITPYQVDDNRLGIISTTLIPTPEAEDYMIQAERKESVETSLSATQREYLDFFGALKHDFEQRTGITLAQPPPRSWYSIRTGVSGIHFEWMFHGRPRTSFSVELHFERADAELNQTSLAKFESRRTEIDSATHEKVIFQPEWGSRWSRLYIECAAEFLDEELKTWAIEKMEILYKLLLPDIQTL